MTTKNGRANIKHPLNIVPSFHRDDLVDKVVRINYYIRFIFMIAIYLMLNI